jgi:hypothetical protein
MHKNEGNFLTNWGTISFSSRTLLHGVGCSVAHLVTQLVSSKFRHRHFIVLQVATRQCYWCTFRRKVSLLSSESM